VAGRSRLDKNERRLSIGASSGPTRPGDERLA
jgi:hypothetical protein